MASQNIAPERLRMRAAFAEACSHHPAWATVPAEQRETLIRRIERNCLEVTIASCVRDGIDRLYTEKKFVDRYSAECSRVIANLDPDSSVGSPQLLDKLIAEEINPHTIAKMSSYELCPEASRALREDIELRQKQKSLNKVSRAHTCRKCKNNETIKMEYQGRAADESNSHSIKCVHCEYVWRM